jgi:hypothetical protein
MKPIERVAVLILGVAMTANAVVNGLHRFEQNKINELILRRNQVVDERLDLLERKPPRESIYKRTPPRMPAVEPITPHPEATI